MSYDSMIATARRIIQDKGTACTIRTTTPNIDPAEPWNEASAPTVVDVATSIVLLPFDSVSRRMLGYAMDADIPAGTVMGFIPGNTSYVPALRDTVLVGSKTYTIQSMDTINPNADKDILHVLEMRV